jgi:hypothetical protein
MSFLRWDNAVLIVEYFVLACIFILVLYLLTTMHAQAVSIESIGHSSGIGIHRFSFGGLVKVMILPANLYQGRDFTILQNGTVWTRITGGIA